MLLPLIFSTSTFGGIIMRQETIRRFISFGLLSTLVLAFGLTSEYFFAPENIFNLLRESSVIGILSIGVTMLIITGGNDLSCGALLGLNAMLISRCLYVYNMNITATLSLALAVTIAGGLLNGFLVSNLRIPDFIATLSSQFIFRGLTLILAIRTPSGMITTKTINDPFIKGFGDSTSFGLFYVTIAFFVMAIIGQFILKNTKLGVHIYAIGSNRNSAELSGISFVKIKYSAFMVSAICAFAASLFFLGKIRAAETETGLGLEFAAISATVIGGCAFSGGRGDIIGTVIGVLFLKVLENGVLKFNFSTDVQKVISGIVIVLMLIFDAAYNRYMQEKISKAAVIAREKKAVA